VGGGVATGGGSFGGGGGASTGGGSATGGGGAQNWSFDDAGFTFTAVVPESNSSNHGDYDRVTGLAGNDVWVSDSFGFLRHYDGANWTLIYDFGVMLRYSGLYERADHSLFACGDDALVACTGNCLDPISFVSTTKPQTSFTGVCGSGNEVYVSGASQADGALVMHFNGSGWDKWVAGLTVNSVGGCTVDSAGEVLFGLDTTIGVFSSDGGVFHTEDPGYSTELLTGWNALATIGTQTVAVGPGKKVSVRQSPGNWTPLVDGPNLDNGGNYLGAASSSPSADDVVIAGTQGGAGPAAVYRAGHLTLIGRSDMVSFLGVWGQDESTFWFSGTDQSSGEGVLYKATR
jgi:hypothetical protein